MANLIDGVTPLPVNGATGWGTTLNAAVNAIDARFNWTGGVGVAKYVVASGITGTTLPATLVASSLTGVGVIGAGTWRGTVVEGQYGGTGVANTGKTITVSGNTTIGSSTHTVTFVTSANTSVTLPSTGTLVSTTTTSLASLSTVGTIVSGAWQSTTPVGLAYGGTGKTTAPATMANLMGYTSTVTAAGTTTLTNTSSYYQQFTGSTTQTVKLPVTSTLQTGWTFHIVNNSTGLVTVNSSGANAVIVVPAGTTAMVTCIGITLTTAADWESGITDFSTYTGSGTVVLGTSPAITTSLTTGSTTFALVNTTATTVNFAGAATALTIGASTGTTTVNNALISGTVVIVGQSAAYTLALADRGKTLEMTNAVDAAVTVPPSGTINFPVGSEIRVVRNGAGKVSFTAGVGVTIRSDTAKLFIATQYSSATLIKRGTDEWYLIGNLSAT